jgi:ribosome recycling factor
MSYYKLGTNCEPATIALTSNSKFLQPLSNLYNIHYKTHEQIKKENKKDDISEDMLRELSDLVSKRVEKIKQFNDKSCTSC